MLLKYNSHIFTQKNMRQTFLFIFLIVYFSSYSQTITAIYNVQTLKTLQGRTLNSNESKPLIYSYVYNDRVSKQRLVSGGGIIKSDTIIVDEYGKEHSVNGSINRPSNVIIYKNYLEKKIKVNYTTDREKRSIKDSIPTYNWKLHDENKILLGYHCKKATAVTYQTGSEQKLVAWYAEALPINDGPLTYQGLPGLILEILIDDKSIINFKNVTLQSNINTTIEDPETLAPLTFNQYYMIYGMKN